MVLARRAARALRMVRALLRLEFALDLPPWTRLSDDTTVVGQLRRQSLQVVRRSPAARLLCAVHGVYWPLTATWDATSCVLRHGARVSAACGMTRRQQWRDAMRLAHTMNFSPRTYYLYRFWNPAIRPLATSFLQVDEMATLQEHLRRDVDLSVLGDKVQFAQQCASAGIDTPTIVVSLRRSRPEQWTAATGALPRRDLFVKPVWGQQGAGGERWVYDAATEAWSRRGVTLAHDELLARCRSRARRRPIFVQHCLSNHPDIARFSTGSLCTFRVMTYRDPGCAAELLAVSFKMARTGSDVDNLHAGGMVCAVDPLTGRLSAGITRNPAQGPQGWHPDTHAIVEGAQLTTHDQVIALALAAHDRLVVPWSVGWDVAMTPQGPVLVEGNPLWGIDLLHVPHAVGLPDAFAASLLERVNAT